MTAADPMIAELVREVLAEELARLRVGVPSVGRAREEGVREEQVRIADDADLAAFARRVLAMAGDREARDAFEKGRFVFRLEAGAGTAGAGIDPPAPAASSRAGAGHTDAGHTEVIGRGLLSERHAERLPRGTVRVRLGRNVRMTPLARDRLRRRGIAIERTE